MQNAGKTRKYSYRKNRFKLEIGQGWHCSENVEVFVSETG